MNSESPTDEKFPAICELVGSGAPPLLTCSILIGPLVTGLVLLMLLPLGMTIGVRHPVFQIVADLHLLLLSLTLFATIVFVFRILTSVKGGLLISFGSIVVIALLEVAALHPVTARDALIHHLAAPKMWLASGYIDQISWHEWSYYPMLLQLAFIRILAWGFPELCALYHFSYFLLFAGLLAYVSHRLFTHELSGVMGWLFGLTLPVLMNLATTPLVDGGAAYFSLVTLALLLAALDGGTRSLYWIGTGIALGLALSTKYNVIPFAVLVIVLIPLFSSRYGRTPGDAFRDMVIVGGVAFIVVSPWLIKNLIWIGNPVYPLYQGWFSGDGGRPRAFSPSLTPLEMRTLVYGEDWADIILTPMRMILMGSDGDPRRYDGVLSPVILFGLCSLFPSVRSRRWYSGVALLVVAFYLFALSSTSWRIRYLAPLIGPLLILTIGGVLAVGERVRWKKWVLPTFALTIHGLAASCYLIPFLSRTISLDYLRGTATKEQYLTSRLFEYPVIQKINETLPPTSKVYLLATSNQFFYYDVPVYSGGYYSELPLVTWIKSSRSADDVAKSFRDHGITHLLVQQERALKALDVHFTDFDKTRWNEFESRHLNPLFTIGPYSLWSVM